ncbi:CoA transferase [bacterium]|nr:CoA transferase [bacterium]MCI0606097.1 CoA transferase [bacterium]
MLQRSLEGIRVLDFTRLYPGPLCTLMLADLGADVIKVEAPGGETGRFLPPLRENNSLSFLQLNRNKRSLMLDLRKEEGRSIVKKLLESSDVFIESFRPGVMKRLGLDYANLSEEFPRLVYCSITGYGQTGTNSWKPGHDLNYISVAGIIGSQEKASIIPPVQIADTVGAFQASTAILAALLQRSRTGAGQFLDISLLDGAFFAIILLAGIQMSGLDAKTEQYLNGRLACYNIYRTQDERYLTLALLEPKFWNHFCARMEMSQLADRQFQENQQGLIQTIAEKIAARPLSHWIEHFNSEDVCIAPVTSLAEAFQSDLAKQLFIRVDYPFGSLLQMRTPFVEKTLNTTKAPEPGEHTWQILEDAGFTKPEIEEFTRKGIL